MTPLVAMFAGLSAGALHVLSGPDHLAAVAPLAGDDRRAAWRTGLAWGLGHGGGVLLLGALGLLAATALPLESISLVAEALAGLSLIFVGGWALRRALGVEVQHHEHAHPGSPPVVHAHPHLHRVDDAQPGHGHSHAAAGIGLLHGLAGAGHLAAALPALALGTGAGAAYLAAYLAAAVLVMTAFAGGIAGLRQRLGQHTERLARGFSLALGTTTIAVGVGWLVMLSG